MEDLPIVAFLNTQELGKVRLRHKADGSRTSVVGPEQCVGTELALDFRRLEKYPVARMR
jgi:hypothetical protein